MSAPCPPGVTQGTHANRFNFVTRSQQSYIGVFLMVLGLVIPIILIIQAINNGQMALIGGAAVAAILMCGAGFYMCYKFPWATASIEFDNRQVVYVTAPFPMALWTKPDKNMPITNLGNIIINNTGVSSGGSSGGRRGRGRRPGKPVYEIRVPGNGGAEDFLPLAFVTGHFNIAPVVTAWTLWLQAHGINATNNANTMGEFAGQSGQLAAISASPPGSPMMMQSGPHTGVMMSPVASYGQPAPDYGQPPQPMYSGMPPPPPPGSPGGPYQQPGSPYQQPHQQHPAMPNMAPGANMNYQAY